MNWGAVLPYVVSGAAVSWPVFIAGLITSNRRIRRHVNDVTGQQTAAIEEITRKQTEQIKSGQLRPGRPDGGPGQYHGHDDGAGEPRR